MRQKILYIVRPRLVTLVCLRCLLAFCIPATAVFSVQAQGIVPEDLLQQKELRLYRQDSSSAKWVRRLKNIILVSPKEESEKDTFNIVSAKEQHLAMQGRTITSIRMMRLKPFGEDIDGKIHELSFYERVGNALHKNTREFILRNALFFREGDVINALKLADSERYLRSLRYINDARIMTVPVGDNEAEVIVITHDIFPYSVDAGSNFSSRGNLALSNRDVLGFGFNLKAGVFLNSEKEHLMGYQVEASILNIGKSHISFDATYLDRYEHQKTGIMFNRDFYTPSTKYAGNVTIFQEQLAINFFDPDSSYATINPILVKFKHFDGWLGRSFLLNKQSSGKMSNNITMAFRVQKTVFGQRPYNAQDLYYQFQNRTVYLTSVGFSRQAYYKTNLIYNYDRTEDIPYGYLFSLIGGREYNELYNRPYIGANASWGHFFSKFGYLSQAVSYGTFFHDGATKQGSLNVAVNYFTNLFITGRFKQRTFVNMQYSNQLNNPMNDHLKIDGDAGIPGFRNDSIYGQHRMNLSLEHDLFAPWDIYGFRMVWYAFANFSWLGGYEMPFAEGSLFSSFGMGIRLRNDRLIINTLQIQLAFFPNIPRNSSFRYVHLTKETVLMPRNFSSKAPEIMSLY
jgi:hypothetical protein